MVRAGLPRPAARGAVQHSKPLDGDVVRHFSIHVWVVVGEGGSPFADIASCLPGPCASLFTDIGSSFVRHCRTLARARGGRTPAADSETPVSAPFGGLRNQLQRSGHAASRRQPPLKPLSDAVDARANVAGPRLDAGAHTGGTRRPLTSGDPQPTAIVGEGLVKGCRRALSPPYQPDRRLRFITVDRRRSHEHNMIEP